MSEFRLQRLGVVMEPEPGNPWEVEGVLNPAAARGPDGELYLFPRLVAKGNYSRIGIARVQFDKRGDPVGVERLGIALEPTADYERRADGGGGCEDARVTFVEPLEHYVMTYTAFSQRGPRIALAMSEDLIHWTRIGLARFEPYQDIDFLNVDNKDASIFRSPFRITVESCNWLFCTGRFFPVPVLRRSPVSPSHDWWTVIGKASGFPIARCLPQASSRIGPGCSTRITDWRPRSLPGSSSKSAEGLRL